MMKVTEVNNLSDLFSLRDIWNNLLKRSGVDNVFSTFEWISTWWKYFGDSNKKLFILVVEDNKDIIGIAPLVVDKKRIAKSPCKIKTITFARESPSDYRDFIIIKKREEVLKLILEYLTKNKRLWDKIDLQHIPSYSPNIQILNSLLEKSPFFFEKGIIILCPYITLNGEFEEYFSNLGHDLRYYVRSTIRKLEKISRLEFLHYEKVNEEELDRIIEEFVKLNEKRYNLTKHKGIFLRHPNSEFTKEVIKIFNQKDWLDLQVLKCNGNIICYSICFKYNKILYFWQTSYDPSYYKYSPGICLLKFAIEDSFKRGYKEFDFLRGDEEYKLRWTKTKRENYQFIIYNNRISSKIPILLTELRTIKKRLINW